MNDSDRRFVCAIARRIVGEQDAGDVAQETLLLSHRNRERFRGEASYRTWLYRIATTAALTHLRTQRRRRLDRTVSIDDAGPLPVDDRQRPTPEDELVRADQAAQVRARVDALPPAYRDVLHADDGVLRDPGASVAARRRLAFRRILISGDPSVR